MTFKKVAKLDREDRREKPEGKKMDREDRREKPEPFGGKRAPLFKKGKS